MVPLAFCVFCLLLLMASVQSVLAGFFAALLLRHNRATVRDEELPRVAILLSLRGADPYLMQGLHCLLHQDYPDYELHVVVDRCGDAAWSVAAEAAARPGRVPLRLAELREPLATCGRKCSALIQMASALDDSREVIVLADADVASHASWLRELIAPLADPNVGAAYGNRWFMPAGGRWGSLVRYLWNVAAVVPMWLCKIPWGGTIAIRTKVLRDCGLLQKWSRAAVDDAPIRQALEDRDLQLQFVPSLMMVNREDCTLAFSLDFIKRQLTWTRLYHRNWSVVVVHAVSTTAALAMALVLALAGWTRGEPRASLWAVAGLLSYLSMMLLLTGLLESTVRHVIRTRPEPVRWVTPGVLLRLPVAIPLTQAVHVVAVILAIFKRHVTWRGATYRIAGPWDVRVLSDRPMEKYTDAASNMSL